MYDLWRRYFLAYRNKITNKLFGVVRVPHRGEKKGDVLLSFITGPFIQAPDEYFTDPHPNYWTAEEVARLFSERGYDVDVINWNDFRFIPRKKYAVCVDMQYNLERLARYLPPNCVKVMYLVASHPKFQNQAENRRLLALEERRGVKLSPKRTEFLTSNPGVADIMAGYGNQTVRETYAEYGKGIIPLPIPAMDSYDFPERKDFEKARRHFLWFGGGGAVLKGLDLIIEAFAGLPRLKLTAIGPAAFEKDIERIYAKELKLPNITRYSKPRINDSGEIKTDGVDLSEILNQCGAIIGMSASEGGGGATIHAMQAGLVPIVTPNTGIDERAPAIVIEDPTVENIRKAVLEFSNLPPEKVERRSKDTWKFAREHHTKLAFTKAFENLIDNVIKLK